jgi:hypothetical protein
LLCSTGRRCRHRHDEVDLETRQFGCQAPEPLDLALRPSVLDDNILTLHIAEFAQSCPEGVAPHAYLGRFKRTGHQVAEPCDFRRLRLSREGHENETESENDREPDQPHGHLDG